MGKYKPKGNYKGKRDETAYADGKDMRKLLPYLCTMARPEGSKKANPQACRECESQCAFGKRYAELYDEAQKSEKRPAETKPKTTKAAPKTAPGQKTTIAREKAKARAREAAEKEGDQMPAVRKTCDETTMQEQLERKIHETEALREQVKSLQRALKNSEEYALGLEQQNREDGQAAEKAEAEIRQLVAERDEIRREFEAWTQSMPKAEELEAAKAENAQLRETIALLTDKNERMAREISIAGAAITDTEQQRKDAVQELVRLKAWMFDQLHPMNTQA